MTALLDPHSMNHQEWNAESVGRAIHGSVSDLENILRHVEPELRASLSIQPLWKRSLDVEDILQVSYLEAFLRIGSLRDPTPTGFRAWMRRLTENNLRDAIRALERDKRPEARRRLTHGAQGESARTLLLAMAGDHPTAGSVAASHEQIRGMLRAVSQLPASYRQVIEQVDLAERSVADVSQEMNRSPGAVHLLRSRAHDRLRELLGA